jgi:hypothetical protein
MEGRRRPKWQLRTKERSKYIPNKEWREIKKRYIHALC